MRILIIFFVPFIALAMSFSAFAEEKPVWWEDFKKLADHDGYRLITDEELAVAVSSDEEFLLLDVRPVYEYQKGHLPGARHLEFHEGQSRHIEPQLKDAFKSIAGPDMARKIIIYCRSFR